GVLNVPNSGSLRLVFRIRRQSDAGYAGSMDSPEQNAFAIPLARIALRDDALTLEAPSIDGTYRASWIAAESRWRGEWSQGGLRMNLDLTRLTPTPLSNVTLHDDWAGVLDTGRARMRFIFRIREASSGLTGSLETVDQGGPPIPIPAVRRDGDVVRFEFPSAG